MLQLHLRSCVLPRPGFPSERGNGYCNDHVCELYGPQVIAELLRDKMKGLVRKDPAKSVGKAAGEYFKDIVFIGS